MAAPKPLVGGRQLSWAELCERAGPDVPISSVRARRIAGLWQGYGSVAEVEVEVGGGAAAGPAAAAAAAFPRRLVAKQVDPPPGSGVSHERKLKSYAAEAAFYRHYSEGLLEAGACAVARPLLVDVSLPRHFFLLLTDLREQFPQQLHSYSLEEAAVALDWLAAFHAFFWERVPGQDQPVSHSAPLGAAGGAAAAAAAEVPRGLWDQGCYWHLDTRQEELRGMPAAWKDLKAAAPRIDEVLRGVRADGSRAARHRCLCHGDFKSENVLFDAHEPSPRRCAAYDFQYVGEGLGAKDVAYMMASSVDEGVLERHERELLDRYHASLLAQLRARGADEAAAAFSRRALSAQFELALLDYVRFMAGWGFWGSAGWARRRAREALGRLDEVVAAAREGW